MSTLRRLLVPLVVVAGLLAGRGAAGQGADTLEAAGVRIVHRGQAALAEELAEVLRRPVDVPGFGPLVPPPGSTVQVARTPEQFRELTGGRAPEWAGGVAIAATRTIVVPGYPSATVRADAPAVLLRHEVAHLALDASLPGPIPRWFHEGFAEVASGSWNVEEAWKLRLAFLLGRAPPLDSLSLDWPRGEERARLAYLLSATAVEHLMRRSGEDGFAFLLENWRREGSYDAAVRSTFRMTAHQLEEEWAESVERRYGWVAALSLSAALWLVVAVLVGLAWWPRRRRNRRRLSELRAEEHMLPPPRDDGVDVQYPLP